MSNKVNDEVKIKYQRQPVYELRLKRRTVVFIMAIMFGAGGDLNSGSGVFRGLDFDSDKLGDAVFGVKSFWYDAPYPLVAAFRSLLF